MWVKFDGMEVACICDEHHRKCRDTECKEYVVKFTEVVRSPAEEVQKEVNKLSSELSKLNTELKRSINKFKI
jgi:predicted nuclease with TOPRIM domain